MNKKLQTLFVLGAVVCAASCIYLCATYEPDAKTIYFDTSANHSVQEVTSSSSLYYFVFTGKYADKVTWDFGDGTSVEAFEVIKEYDAGQYYITCTAQNLNGERVSAYMLTVAPDDGIGFWTGHEAAIMLMCISVMFMLAAYGIKKGWF